MQQNKADLDWKKSLQQGFDNWQDLADFLHLDSVRYPGLETKKFPMRIPLSFASRMVKGDINDPLLKQVLPVEEELFSAQSYSNDPLCEDEFNPTKGVLHKYKNRILLMLHPACAVHCRYCFRHEYDYKAQTQSREKWQAAFIYIKAHKEVDEVIFSGGDPFMHNDGVLRWFVEQVSKIAHIKRLRIHTRIPVVLPERITNNCLEIFKDTHLQKIMVIHVNHANEIAEDVIEALDKFKSVGFALLNQSTLLKGVNDDAYVLKNLSEALFLAGVMPYYLHLLDKVTGAAHFDIDEMKAKALHDQLKHITSGYLVPKLVREIAHEKSKTWMN